MGSLIHNKVLVWSVLGVLIVIFGVLVGMQLLQQPQDNRQKAAVAGGTAKLTIKPTSMGLNLNETKTVTVSVSTEGTTIDGITVRLVYPFSGAEAPLKPDAIKLTSTLEGQQVFNCLVKKAAAVGTQMQIDFGCVATNGFTSSAYTDLFTFTLTGVKNFSSQPITISFDATATKISKSGQDIAAIPTGTLVVTMNAPAATASPTPTPTPTPTPALAACDGACQANRDCGNDLICSSGKCRNHRCTTDTTCGCSTVNVASQSGTTTLPKTGFDQTTLFLSLGVLFILGGTQLLFVFARQPENEESDS